MLNVIVILGRVVRRYLWSYRLILHVKGWGVEKGAGTSESHAFKASKFLSIPKEIAIRETFYMHLRYISLKIFRHCCFLL